MLYGMNFVNSGHVYFFRCSFCKVKFDFIGKVENLSTGLQYVTMIRAQDMRSDTDIKLNKTNYTLSNGDFSKFWEQLSLKQRRLLRDFYRNDFEAFSYDVIR